MTEAAELMMPAPRPRERRLSDELKNFPVDTVKGTVLDIEQGRALMSYGRRRGWKMVQRSTASGRLAVWRVA